MNDPTEIWRDFQLDGNCVALVGEDQKRVYLSQVRRSLQSLRDHLESEPSVTEVERQTVAGYVERLAQTYEILGLRHFFSEASELKIDATDSGFVHFSILLELAAELEGRDAKLAELKSVAEMKRSMLEEIVHHGIHPRALQVELMRRLYLESLSEEKAFRVFVPGRLERVGRSNHYFWSFSTYDRALNRPFVYLIYFSYESETDADALSADTEAFAEIRAAAESGALGRIGLLGFANGLDHKIDRVAPRIVKRLIIGPYWAPHLTRTDEPIGGWLDRFDDRLPFAMRWETETLLAERETRVDVGWFSKGRKRQVYWIPKDPELSARGVSRVDRYLLVPDWLAGRIHADGGIPDHRCLPIAQHEAA